MIDQSDRRAFLGATDIAAIAGVSPWRTPLQVWLEKTGNAAPQVQTPAMRRGILFEPVVAQMYSEQTGVALQEFDERQVHEQHPFLTATPDRLAVPDDGAQYLVEIKTHKDWLRDEYGPEGTDRIPDHEAVQVTWQMFITMYARRRVIVAPYADLAALFGTDTFGVWRVPYDNALAETLHDIALRFWYDHVVVNIPPEPEAGDVDLMRRVYPSHTERVIRATDDLEEEINHLRKARQYLAVAEREVAEHTARIQAAMMDSAVLEFGDHEKITWRTSKPSVRRTCDYDALRAQNPDLYAAVVTEAETPGARRFVVPRSWGKEDE